jgi:hypothetical protein
MKQYDVLKVAESVLRMLSKNGVDVKDVEHLAMYEDLKRLEREGHKKTYIVHYLGEQYKAPPATIYRVEKRMEREMK